MKKIFLSIATLILICSLMLTGVSSALAQDDGDVDNGNDEWWEGIWDWFADHGWGVLMYMGLGIILYLLLHRIAPRLVKRAMVAKERGRLREEIEQRSDTLISVLTGIGTAIIVVVVLVGALMEIGLNVGPAIAGLGIVGLAIGFGAQNLVRDLIAGFFILLEDQYAVGDWVATSGVDGEVEKLNMRRTVVRDLDGVVHSIPNGEITVASNYTKDFGRANVTVSVAYKENLDQVLSLVRKTWDELVNDPELGPKILSKDPWILRVDALGASGIDIRIVGETLPMWQWEVMAKLRLRLKQTFDEMGIEIPWPHTKVYFGDSPEKLKGGSGKHDQSVP